MPETKINPKVGFTKFKATKKSSEKLAKKSLSSTSENKTMTLSEFWKTQRMSNHIWEVK